MVAPVDGSAKMIATKAKWVKLVDMVPATSVFDGDRLKKQDNMYMSTVVGNGSSLIHNSKTGVCSISKVLF